jgi:hypothetical protein
LGVTEESPGLFALRLFLLPADISVLQQHASPLGLIFLVADRHHSTS